MVGTLHRTPVLGTIIVPYCGAVVKLVFCRIHGDNKKEQSGSGEHLSERHDSKVTRNQQKWVLWGGKKDSLQMAEYCENPAEFMGFDSHQSNMRSGLL